MKDPVLIERADLEQLAEMLLKKSADKVLQETFQTWGVKPRDLNRTLPGVTEVQRFCRQKGVRIGRKKVLDNIPYKRNGENGRYEFKEKDVVKYLNQ